MVLKKLGEILMITSGMEIKSRKKLLNFCLKSLQTGKNVILKIINQKSDLLSKNRKKL